MMIPFFIGFDILTACKAKCLYLVDVYVRIKHWVPGIRSKKDLDFSKSSKNFNGGMTKYNKNTCYKCNRIVCAKHSETGCGDCLKNNKLMFFT